jgi:hypothetical protein
VPLSANLTSGDDRAIPRERRDDSETDGLKIGT